MLSHESVRVCHYVISRLAFHMATDHHSDCLTMSSNVLLCHISVTTSVSDVPSCVFYGTDWARSVWYYVQHVQWLLPSVPVLHLSMLVFMLSVTFGTSQNESLC